LSSNFAGKANRDSQSGCIFGLTYVLPNFAEKSKGYSLSGHIFHWLFSILVGTVSIYLLHTLICLAFMLYYYLVFLPSSPANVIADFSKQFLLMQLTYCHKTVWYHLLALKILVHSRSKKCITSVSWFSKISPYISLFIINMPPITIRVYQWMCNPEKINPLPLTLAIVLTSFCLYYRLVKNTWNLCSAHIAMLEPYQTVLYNGHL
jgi:hypothetical protein